MVPADRDKVSKACQGDHSAFSDLIQERKDDIYRIAYTYTKNRDDALDIVNEVVYKSFVGMKKMRNPEFYNTWLSRITINCCMDYLKKRQSIARFEEHGQEAAKLEQIPDSSQAGGNLLTSVDLFNALDKLNLEQRTVVILKYYQDLTLAQIAELLIWPLGTVKTRLNKALEVLRIELKEGYNDCL